MVIKWSLGARQILEMMSASRQKQVESEINTVFADSIPPSAQDVVASDAQFVELPCGVEAGFRKIEGGVRILFLIGSLGDAVHAEHGQIRRQVAL